MDLIKHPRPPIVKPPGITPPAAKLASNPLSPSFEVTAPVPLRLSPAQVSSLADSVAQSLSGLRDSIRSLVQARDASPAPDKLDQFREISRTIKRLEARRLPVPHELKSLLAQLQAETDLRTPASQALSQLERELQNLMSEIRGSRASHSAATTRPRRSRGEMPRTDREVLCDYLVAALKAQGGTAHISAVMDWIEKNLGPKLLPGDQELKPNGQRVWQYHLNWARWRLVKRGVVKAQSPRGIWELSQKTS